MRTLWTFIGLLAILGTTSLAAPAYAGDRDGDGVPNAEDLCPTEAAETRSGCRFERVTHLYSVGYETGRKGWVDGFLASTGGSCHERTWVRLYQERRGRDRLVGADVTASGSADGFFSIETRIKRGRLYYTKVRRQLGETIICSPFRSRSMRLSGADGEIGHQVGSPQR